MVVKIKLWPKLSGQVGLISALSQSPIRIFLFSDRQWGIEDPNPTN
jgi:hypothetical protein